MSWVAIPAKHRWSTRERPLFDDGLWDIHNADDMEKLPICTVDRGDDHDAPTRARAEGYARLIAAAPELLEVAKKFIEHFTLPDGRDDALLDDDDVANLKLAREAVAKADGR